jgi:subtilase family serine protease
VFFESQCFGSSETQSFTGNGNATTYTGNRYGADITNTTFGTPCGYQPSEMHTAYQMTPLFAAGFDGSGQTIVITDTFGSPTIQTDAEAFSKIYGLPEPDSRELSDSARARRLKPSPPSGFQPRSLD